MTDAELDALMALHAASDMTGPIAWDDKVMYDSPRGCRQEFWAGSKSNAALIAAAVNVIPALVAAARERDRLRGLLGRYASHVGDCEGTFFTERCTWLTQSEADEIRTLGLAADEAGAPFPNWWEDDEGRND